MSNYFYPAQHHSSHMPPHTAHNHHHAGRSRRAPRLGSSGNPHKQVRNVRTPKEQPEPPTVTVFRREFEAAKSFDVEDDDVFCPFHLLTEDDLSSIHSSGSDRSSLSSGSPQTSPLQPLAQPTPTFLLPSAANTYNGPFHQSTAQTKLHQPLAQRTRNAIPIVDPTTRAVASPPPSVSPARQMQQYTARRW